MSTSTRTSSHTGTHTGTHTGSRTQGRPRQELAQRTAAGIEVTMFWTPDDDSLVVRVVDLFAEDCFEMPVSKERGSFAYRHPFAYAAELGLDPLTSVYPAA
jgi:hypothetical protein